jgi:hypothetical protein
MPMEEKENTALRGAIRKFYYLPKDIRELKWKWMRLEVHVACKWYEERILHLL